MHEITIAKDKVEKNLEEFHFRDALFEVIELSRKGNQYLQKKEPWKKSETEEAGRQSIDNTMHLSLQLMANLSILINPFLPTTATKMLHLMKVVEKMLDWKNAGSLKLLSVGYSLRAPELLFRKIEDEEIAAQIEKLNTASKQTAAKMENQEQAPATNPIPASAPIQFEDFAKVELRTGTILSAEKVEKADKLLKLEVDMGTEKRTIVSGIALHYEPTSLIGKQVVIVANLAPRKMRGIESNGMILMAEDKDGKLHFVNAGETAGNGSKVS